MFGIQIPVMLIHFCKEPKRCTSVLWSWVVRFTNDIDMECLVVSPYHLVLFCSSVSKMDIRPAPWEPKNSFVRSLFLHVLFVTHNSSSLFAITTLSSPFKNKETKKWNNTKAQCTDYFHLTGKLAASVCSKEFLCLWWKKEGINRSGIILQQFLGVKAWAGQKNHVICFPWLTRLQVFLPL